MVVFFGVSNSNGSLCDAPPFVPVLFACMCGMTCASWYSVAPVLLAETSPSRTRGRAFALYITASSILGAFTFGELLKVIQTDDDDGSNNDKFYVVLFVLIFVVVCMGTFIAAIESPGGSFREAGRVIDAQALVRSNQRLERRRFATANAGHQNRLGARVAGRKHLAVSLV